MYAKVAVKNAPSPHFIGCIIITTVIIIAPMMSPMQEASDYDPDDLDLEARQARYLDIPWDLRGPTDGVLCPPESAGVS